MNRVKKLLRRLRHLLRGCGPFGPWTGEGRRGPWLRCADFGPRAKNHCAATAAANAVLLLGEQARPELCRRAYAAIGPGPILGPRKLRRFLAREGYGPKALPLGDLEALCGALDQGQPCLLLLAQKPWSWHWVLARSYRREGRALNQEGATLRLEIADGWNAVSRSLCPAPEAPWLGAWAFLPKRS